MTFDVGNVYFSTWELWIATILRPNASISSYSAHSLTYQSVQPPLCLHSVPRMTKKRRNGGKNRKGRGHTRFVRCSNCGRCVAKDKAIKRFLVKNMIETAAQGDIAVASIYPSGTYVVPKLYIKTQYCISCAIHARLGMYSFIHAALLHHKRAPCMLLIDR